jgi:hypothetical protein
MVDIFLNRVETERRSSRCFRVKVQVGTRPGQGLRLLLNRGFPLAAIIGRSAVQQA